MRCPGRGTAARTCFITRRVMRCGQDGPDARRPTKAICRYGRGGQRSSRRAAARSRGPGFRGCDREGAHWPVVQAARPARFGSHLRVNAQALLRRPRASWPQPAGTGRRATTPLRRPVAQRQMDEAQATSACSGAHLFVGSPRNIDILLRALLLDLHPSSPPSHTCLVMKQVLYGLHIGLAGGRPSF